MIPQIPLMPLNFTGAKVNTVYYNDLHGSAKYADTFLSERDKFYKRHKKDINLTLSGGDAFSDTNPNNDKIAEKLIAKTDAIAVGNHDAEGGFKYFADMVKKYAMQGKWLACNLFSTNPDKKDYNDCAIAKSKVIVEKGEKIGVIGVAPFDLRQIAFINDTNNDILVEGVDKTEQAIRAEVKNLEDNNVDKIFLLSHTGIESQDNEKYYERFAKIGGIDVIIGGHDHKQADETLYTERNEPVKVVATGAGGDIAFNQNLNQYGELELEFDDNGVLIEDKCKNTIKATPQPKAQKSPVVGKIHTPMKEVNPLLGHSEIGNFVADACFEYAKNHGKEMPDFAIVNPGSIRAAFIKRKVTEADIQTAAPFVNTHLISAPLTKKQIVDTLDTCAKTVAHKRVSPGMMQVSGLEYSVDKNLDVYNVCLTDENGEVIAELDEFPDDYSFRVVFDNYLATGVPGFGELKKDVDTDTDVESFGVSRQIAISEYLMDSKNIKNYTNERIHII